MVSNLSQQPQLVSDWQQSQLEQLSFACYSFHFRPQKQEKALGIAESISIPAAFCSVARMHSDGLFQCTIAASLMEGDCCSSTDSSCFPQPSHTAGTVHLPFIHPWEKAVTSRVWLKNLQCLLHQFTLIDWYTRGSNTVHCQYFKRNLCQMFK